MYANKPIIVWLRSYSALTKADIRSLHFVVCIKQIFHETI